MSKNTQISELINYISVNESGNIVFTTVPPATTNTDKFLVSDSGVLKFRTAAQLVSDIGAQASGSYQAALSGTGFVKISGSTISYDNSTYLTTSSASSTYLPLSGGTLTGALSGTSASFNSTITGSSLISNGQVSLYDYINVQNNFPNFTQLSGIRGRAYYQTNYPTSILMGDPGASNTNIMTFNVSNGDVTGTEKMRITSAGISVNGNISISGNNYLDFNNGDARIVNTSGQLSFQTYTVGSFATRMVITGPGNVGIGASSLLERLSVNGNIHVEGVGSSIYFDTDGSGRAIRQYVANLYDFHIINGRGVSSRFILGSNVISLGTTSTPQFSMTLSTGASTFSGSISAGGNISGASIIGSLFQTSETNVSGVSTSFVNSGTSFGNTTGIWLVSITAFGDGNMYSAALYVVTTAAYSKTLNLIGGPSNHFGNGSVVAELSTTDGVSADLRVRRTTVGSATVYVKVIRTGS